MRPQRPRPGGQGKGHRASCSLRHLGRRPGQLWLPFPRPPAPQGGVVQPEKGALCGLHPGCPSAPPDCSAGRRVLGPDAALGRGQLPPPTHTAGPCLHSAHWVPKTGKQSCGRPHPLCSFPAVPGESLPCFPAAQGQDPAPSGPWLPLCGLEWVHGSPRDSSLTQGAGITRKGPGGRFRRWVDADGCQGPKPHPSRRVRWVYG